MVAWGFGLDWVAWGLGSMGSDRLDFGLFWDVRAYLRFYVCMDFWIACGLAWLGFGPFVLWCWSIGCPSL